jgi:hypothetical protein
MHWLTVRVAGFLALIAASGFAQQPAAPEVRNATCVFEDGQQARISYAAKVEDIKKDLPKDKIWTPGNQPMILFTDTSLTLGGTNIPAGAYSMYFIPSKDNWTVIVNKDVTPGDQYDQTKDIARAMMETGRLPESQSFQLAFAHMKAKQCSLRVYYGKVGVWAEFNEP